MGHAMSVQKSGAATSGRGFQVKLTNVDLPKGFKSCKHFIRVSRLEVVRIPFEKWVLLTRCGWLFLAPKYTQQHHGLNVRHLFCTVEYFGFYDWIIGGPNARKGVCLFSKWGDVAFTCIYMSWNSWTLPNVLKGELAYHIRKGERVGANMLTKFINHYLRNSQGPCQPWFSE